MATKKVGTLIKEARTNADMTQEQLARKISGLSASDISLAERGQKDLTQAQLKQIAKITGVTQASLVNAAKVSSSKSTTTSKTTAKTTGKTAAKKTTTTRKTTTTKKTTESSSSTSSVKVTAAEKKVLELYRAADADVKKSVVNLLKGKEDESTDSILGTILETVQTILDNQ